MPSRVYLRIAAGIRESTRAVRKGEGPSACRLRVRNRGRDVGDRTQDHRGFGRQIHTSADFRGSGRADRAGTRNRNADPGYLSPRSCPSIPALRWAARFKHDQATIVDWVRTAANAVHQNDTRLMSSHRTRPHGRRGKPKLPFKECHSSCGTRPTGLRAAGIVAVFSSAICQMPLGNLRQDCLQTALIAKFPKHHGCKTAGAVYVLLLN
jgi:hypothetical protein